MKHQNQLRYGAVISYLTVAFNALSGLLYTPWMVKTIGEDDYGLYTLAISIVSFFIMDFGLSDTVTRFLSKYYEEDDLDEIGMFLSIVYKLFIIISGCVFLILLCIYFNLDSIYTSFNDDQLQKLKQLFAVVSFYSVVSLPFIPMQGILRANERFICLNSIVLIQRVVNVVVIVICLLMNQGVLTLVIVNAITTLLSSISQYIAVRILTNAKAQLSYWNLEKVKSVFDFSAWITIAQISQRFIFVIAPSIIAILSNSREVAIFGLASSLEGYVYSVANAINGLFMPKVSRSANDKVAINQLMIAVGHLQVIVIGFIYIAFFAAGDRFIDCWIGNKYSILYLCVMLLITPSLFDLPQTIGDTALITEGIVFHRAIVYVSMAIINLINLFVLVPHFGCLGACLGIMLAYLVRTIAKDYLYYTYIGINLSRFFMNVFIKWIIFAVPIAITGRIISNICSINGWFGFIIVCLVIFIIYAFVIYKYFLTSDEKRLLSHIR